MEPSIIEEAPKVKEFPHATIEAKEVFEIHVEKETSKEEPCYIMSRKSIEIKEKERVKEKERLVERSYSFDSISIISKEREHFECSKEKESELEKTERVKEIFMENGYQFYFLNYLGTLLETKQFIEFNSISCAIPIVDEYHFNIANYASCVLGVEDKGRSMEKELGTILEELLIGLSLNPFLMCYEVSFLKLKLFLESYRSHVSIIGDLYAISFGDGLFLVVHYLSKCLSSHTSLEDLLMSSGVKFDPSCYDLGMLDDTSLVSPNIVGFELDCASFDILHDECLGKFIEDVDMDFLSLMLS
ncbi:hypothetical protein M9H77_30672 [Catharanthus roseus]|uniref:Uncharacterized protein n=1 Tax=Catharanthus roseus TaxID=4058 RepID=A0ACB9ZXW1_CATRO|nr:hypothetical protein M9H77_30672 [Catharanthus roseus]